MVFVPLNPDAKTAYSIVYCNNFRRAQRLTDGLERVRQFLNRFFFTEIENRWTRNSSKCPFCKED